MMCKLIKVGVLGALGLAVAGGLVFGRDLGSYASSAARSVTTSVRGTVPIDFELRRARDLVNDILPEMQANVRLIAQQEVEIDGLKDEIVRSEKSITEERERLTTLRNSLNTAQASFTFGRVTYSRDDVKTELASRLDGAKEAEMILASKRKLLDARQKSLAAAIQSLEKARQQKALLESQIATLDGQNKLIQAASNGSSLEINQSKLAQSQKLINEIKKQLEISQRVLAHESHFVDTMQISPVNETDLMVQTDEYLNGKQEPAKTAGR
jgi:predicted  nucleic acid-binding Zn-ribbon protein